MEQLSLFDLQIEEKKEKPKPKAKPKNNNNNSNNNNSQEELLKRRELEQSLKIQEYDMLEISKEVFQQISEYYKTDKLKIVAFNDLISIHSSNDMFSFNKDYENLQKLNFYQKYNVVLFIYPSSIYIHPNKELAEKISIRERQRFKELMKEYEIQR